MEYEPTVFFVFVDYETVGVIDGEVVAILLHRNVYSHNSLLSVACEVGTVVVAVAVAAVVAAVHHSRLSKLSIGVLLNGNIRRINNI